MNNKVLRLLIWLKRKEQRKPLIHHSDRGLQYCANDYQNTLNKKRNIAKYDPKTLTHMRMLAERINETGIHD
jgi:transposase InsO family protein